MDLYKKAIACIPITEWDQIIETWKEKYPNPNSYIRIRGGYPYVQSVASDLSFRNIPFTVTNSQLQFIFAAYDNTFSPEDLVEDPPDKREEIRFLSLPDEFFIGGSLISLIQFKNGVVYYKEVPIPVLQKMHEIGEFFA